MKILTTSYGSSDDFSGIIVAISVDTLLVGSSNKYECWGVGYVFLLAVDGSSDERTRLIPINGIAS